MSVPSGIEGGPSTQVQMMLEGSRPHLRSAIELWIGVLLEAAQLRFLQKPPVQARLASRQV